MKGGIQNLISFETNGIDCVIARILEEIRPAEVRLPKSGGKNAFLSPHVGRPGKAFLDRATILKLDLWAKTNIKCSNQKNWHVRGHRCAVPPHQTSPIPPSVIKVLHYCPHVQHVCCAVHSSNSVGQRSEHCTVLIVHCSRCAVVCRWSALVHLHNPQ